MCKKTEERIDGRRLSGEAKHEHTCNTANLKAYLRREKKKAELLAQINAINTTDNPKKSDQPEKTSLSGDQRFDHFEKIFIRKANDKREAEIIGKKRDNALRELINIPLPFKTTRQAIRSTVSQTVEFLNNIRSNEPEACPFCKCETIENTGRNNLNKCGSCKKTFNVKTGTKGTIFEEFRLPSVKWIEAILHELTLNGGATAAELAEYLDISLKTASRVLRAIRSYGFKQYIFKPIQTAKQAVFSIDLTYRDGENRNRQVHKKRSHQGGKEKAILLVIRQHGGNARVFRINDEEKTTIQPIIRRYVPEGSVIYTDQAGYFVGLSEFYAHKTINHSFGIYGDDEGVTTNGVEGFNSFFKCGLMKFRNNIRRLDVMLYANAAAFRYNARNLSKIEQLVLVIINMLKYGKGSHAKVIKVAQAERKRQRAEKQKLKQFRLTTRSRRLKRKNWELTRGLPNRETANQTRHTEKSQLHLD